MYKEKTKSLYVKVDQAKAIRSLAKKNRRTVLGETTTLLEDALTRAQVQ